MRALDFEFARSAHRQRRWLRIACFGLLAVVTLVEGVRVLSAWQRYEEGRGEQARLAERTQEARRAAEAPEQEMSDEVRRAEADMTRRLSVPWGRLFSALDSSVDQNVALLSLAPDAVAGTVVMVAEARTADAAAGFVKRLRNTAVFREIYISENSTHGKDPQVLRVTIRSRWNNDPLIESPHDPQAPVEADDQREGGVAGKTTGGR